MIERQPTRRTIWIGRVLSLLVVALLLADGAVNLLAPELLEAQMTAVGFPVGLAPLLGVIMLICALIGIVAWAGLFLRDSKVRMVLPIREHETGSSSLR